MKNLVMLICSVAVPTTAFANPTAENANLELSMVRANFAGGAVVVEAGICNNADLDFRVPEVTLDYDVNYCGSGLARITFPVPEGITAQSCTAVRYYLPTDGFGPGVPGRFAYTIKALNPADLGASISGPFYYAQWKPLAPIIYDAFFAQSSGTTHVHHEGSKWDADVNIDGHKVHVSYQRTQQTSRTTSPSGLLGQATTGELASCVATLGNSSISNDVEPGSECVLQLEKLVGQPQSVRFTMGGEGRLSVTLHHMDAQGQELFALPLISQPVQWDETVH